MKCALVSLNVRYIHKNLALRWLYVSKPDFIEAKVIEGVVASPQLCADEILAYAPDVVGISCFIFNVDATRILIQQLKAASPNLRILLGGPEATYHSEAFWDLPIEGILRGEAEFSFWDAVQHKTTQGYQTSLGQEVAILKTDLNQLESLESPYFLDFDAHDRTKRYLYAETSRGCPYGCTYCMAALDRNVRVFSLEYLEKFFTRLKIEPVSQVKFLDRTFNLHPQRAMQLAQWCIDTPKPTTFHVELVGDALSQEFKSFMIQHVDRFRMEIGVQSFHIPTLKSVGRVSNLEKLKQTILEFSQAKVHQHTDLIAGLPFESFTQLSDSLDQMVRLEPMEIQLGILKLLKGTTLYQEIATYAYQFEKTAPYQVISNRWISREEIQQVELAALAMEKCYNSGRLHDELLDTFKSSSSSSMEILVSIGQAIKALHHPYTLKDFYISVEQGLSKFDDHAQRKIENAYYRSSKLKPPRLFEKEPIENLKHITKCITQLDPNLEKHNAIYLLDSDTQHVNAWFYLNQEVRHYTLTKEGDYLNHETYPSHP